MQWFKRSALAAALLFLIPLSGYSASDDGTFTITIQGPEVEDTNTRPARNTNRQNQRQQRPLAPQPGQKNRCVGAEDQRVDRAVVEHLQNLFGAFMP